MAVRGTAGDSQGVSPQLCVFLALAVALCWASALVPLAKGDIVWGGPSYFTYYGQVQVNEANIRRGSELAFNSSNARPNKMGALAYNNLSTAYYNDDGNLTRTVDIAVQLLGKSESEFFGVLAAPDAEGAAATYFVLKGAGVDTIPFVGLWSGLSELQSPFKKWVFNTLPTSFLSLTYAFIKFLATDKLLSRFALYYPAPSLISGVDIRGPVEQSLGALGLRLVSYYAAPSFASDEASIAAAVANISAGAPQAVIMVVAGVQLAPFVRMAKTVMASNVIYVADGSTATNITKELVTPDERRDMYLVFPVPLLSDTSVPVVNDFWQDKAALDAGWDNILEPASLVGYINGRWVASVFESMRGPTVTRSGFMDAAYKTSIHDVGGVRMGPFYDDCSKTGCLACCNAGARAIYLVQFPNGVLEYVPNAVLEWQTCFPQPSDVELPLKVGESGSYTGANGPSGNTARAGLASAFAAINAKGSFNGRQMVLISYDDNSQPAQYAGSNYEQLVTLDNVLSLSGIVGHDSLVAALNATNSPIIGVSVTSPSVLNNAAGGFNRRLVSVTGSSSEELAGALDFFVSERGQSNIGIYYENTIDGRLTRRALVKALALRGLVLAADLAQGSSQAPSSPVQVWFVYNPTGELVQPFLQSYSYPTTCIISSIDPDRLVAELNASSTTTSRAGGPVDLSALYFTNSLPNPNPADAEANSTSQLIADYHAALGTTNTPSYLSLSGYVNGRLLAAIISNINGQVTSKSLLDAVYTAGKFDLGGLELGVFYDNCNATGIPCCNRGARSVNVVSPDANGTWTTRHAFAYDQCHFTFDASASSDGGLNGSDVALVATLVPVGAIFFVLLALAACVILGLLANSRRRRHDDWEIDFGELEMCDLLGQGGFGEVYKAQWRGTEVAVKILNPNATKSREQRDAFMEETRVMSQLRHPNVVLFMGSCRHPNPCIVMEYMVLGSLYDLLHNELMTEIPIALKLKMMYQAAKGMHFLHSSGIVHRDLKSLNLLLDNRWNLKVCDFGLTRLKDSLRKRGGDENEALVCSIPWTAPEVLQDSIDIDYNLADVYSFGIILWEVLTRQDPFAGLSPAQIAISVIRNDLRPSLDHLDQADEQYLELMQNCWHRDPVCRPVFLDVMNSLQTIGNQHGSSGFGNSASKTSSSSGSSSHHSGMAGTSTKHSGSGSKSTGSAHSSQHEGKRLSLVPRRDVSFVVCDLARFNEAWKSEPAAAERSVEQYVQLIRNTARHHQGSRVFSPPSLHSGGTVMLSFLRPDQAVLFAVKLQGEVAAARWTVSTGIRSRVSLHYCEGQCPAPQDDHLRLGYQEKVYQEALRINICCPPGAVLCSTAFEQAVSNGTRPLPAEVGIRFTFIDARECFRVSSDSLEAQSDDGGSDSSLSLGSFEGVMDTELGICSSNRCAWIVDNREITLGALLGQGNYGRVTKGIYKGMPVAVKRLFASRLDDAAMRKMRREAAILSGLTHPNIVQLMGLSITDGGNLLLVMELVERGSLADLLADSSAKLTWAKKLSILRDAAAGIRFLHQNGIIHRDIKSSNLLVDENWNVKVADFGFATAKQDNCTMTRCGTPAWTAPEILSGGEHMAYDDKADVYSFGIVMWEVLTRSKPYQDVNTVTVAVNVINGQRPTIPAGADKAYSALMRKCWAESPQKRPAIDDVLVYFNSALDDGQLL